MGVGVGYKGTNTNMRGKGYACMWGYSVGVYVLMWEVRVTLLLMCICACASVYMTFLYVVCKDAYDAGRGISMIQRQESYNLSFTRQTFNPQTLHVQLAWCPSTQLAQSLS
jgi:hypothetical protein